ncbi:phage major capsid protein [Bacillus sp. WMMC1349]|uniref:phage major capsid protein n=1 Tax=Bacillus sp. WMMC1349 TaxID=2736254 RepID=UPI001553C92E|nr:phage major capsid protein [Bacillus sp. WMMC1349]NPC94797.1 phage major capsid protein [Bacillus sp. WMMC1349]NPC94845.1 phage major capsid protein [Bacillus sp. WMMC1349]
MLHEKIQETRSLITEKQTAINAKIADAQKRAEEDKLDEATSLKDEVTKMKAELEDLKAKLAEYEELAGLKKEEVNSEDRQYKPEERSLPGDKRNLLQEKQTEEVRAFETFLRTKGETREGLKSDGAEAIIPINVITKPQQEPEDVVDLATIVNNVSVTTASGSYPVLANADTGLVSVAELEKNPELAKPKFNKVPWAVETYRGQLPISQEAIDDSGVDLTAIVANHLQQVKRITKNTKVAEVLRSFPAKAVTGTDEIKRILNVDLKQAYARNIVVTASAFQFLDTLKDKDGQYILRQDISTATGKMLLGSPVQVVDDTVLGKKAGDAVMFIGDLKKAVFFANRVDATAKWVENDVYGQVLSLAVRFDVKKADEKAGYFVTITPPAPEKTPAPAK